MTRWICKNRARVLVVNKQLHMEHLGAGQIGEEHSCGDRQQEQRLKAFLDRKIDEHGDDEIHDECFGPEEGNPDLQAFLRCLCFPEVFSDFPT